MILVAIWKIECRRATMTPFRKLLQMSTVLAWITEVVVFKSINGKKDNSINLRAVMKIQYEVLQCLAYS